MAKASKTERPIFPHKTALRPCPFKISAIIQTTVDLPLEPVIPTTGFSTNLPKSSTSLIKATSLLALKASAMAFFLASIPGLIIKVL